MNPTSFTVLISVYKNDDAQFFHDAMESISRRQTLVPNEIVLVIDGPVGDVLNRAIDVWDQQTDFDVNVVRLPENVGLAKALNIGLDHCSHEYVARMDSDDVSCPERFETQMRYLIDNGDIALLGGWYRQYDQTLENYLTDRKVPSGMQEITAYSRSRTPFNHVTAIFKKSAVNKVGGYPDIRGYMEDWWVALRLLKQGYQLANLPDYLVDVRGDREFIGRRGGWSYLMDELANFKAMHREGLIGTLDLLKNISIRTSVRLMPIQARSLLYRAIRRV